MKLKKRPNASPVALAFADIMVEITNASSEISPTQIGNGFTQEDWILIGTTTLIGAGAGFDIGGPVGAAIGALVGAIVGFLSVTFSPTVPD